jgi:asparagine synthetase B (glutamine-hydrolysing)
VLEAISAWGTAALDDLVGMFALALWDKRQQRLLLARDRLGKKPLFFAHLPGKALAFASDPRAVAIPPSGHGMDSACSRAICAELRSLQSPTFSESRRPRLLRRVRHAARTAGHRCGTSPQNSAQTPFRCERRLKRLRL